MLEFIKSFKDLPKIDQNALLFAFVLFSSIASYLVAIHNLGWYLRGAN